MTTEAERLICVDVGGTKVDAGIVGPEGVVPGTQARFETPHRNVNGFLEQMGNRVLQLATAYNLDTAVMGFNGPTRMADGRCYVGPLALIFEEADSPFDIGQRLYEVVPELEGVKVLSLNDAEAAAYAAPRYARGNGVTLFVNQGTGIGGDAISAEGHSLRKHGYLSEYGEMPLWHEGDWVTWGSLVSGQGIQERYGAVHGSDQNRTAAELYQDPKEDWIWDKVGEHFALGLVPLCSNIGPSDVIIGGSVSQCSPKYWPALERVLDKALGCLSHDCATQLPNVTFVPPADLPTLPLLGAYAAFASRHDECVRIGPAQ
jgi:predicted NBD/HSP70 family sugar kinase